MIALHGYNHVCITSNGGINPVNYRSEFAGVPIEIQISKIKKGIDIFKKHGIEPKVFFAPSHTFDENTIKALLEHTDIRVISDTVANKPYKRYGMTFIPQQSGTVRELPLNTVTFCYHPNVMEDIDFKILDDFLERHREEFYPFFVENVDRTLNLYDRFLQKLYFYRR